jgi:rhodanese-related sulfurtransferase
MNTTITNIIRDTAILLAASGFLAFAYNVFAAKPLSWVRVQSDRVMASDSLINTLASSPQPSSPQPSTSQTSITTNTEQAKPTEASNKETSAPLKRETTETTPKAAEKSLTATQQPASKQQPSNQAVSTQATAPKPLEIRIDQVEKLLANPDVLFIDARKANEYERGHIGNAINIFTPEFEQNIPRVIGLPREKPIVVYCGGGACELSHELAAHLVGLGFTRIFVYVGGWHEWEEKKKG